MEELGELFAIAKRHSPKAHALVQLLYGGCCRIQDVVGLPYAKITKAVPDDDGWIVVRFEAKKTKERPMKIEPEVIDVVEAFQ